MKKKRNYWKLSLTYLQNNLQNNYKVSFNKASENTTFFVTLLVESSGNKILTTLPDAHLDITMWNWLCVKTGIWKCILTFLAGCFEIC